MAEDIKIYTDCGRCLGTGIRVGVELDANGNPVTEDPCKACNGTGRTSFGVLKSSGQMGKILRRLKQIMDKLEIKDEVSEDKDE